MTGEKQTKLKLKIKIKMKSKQNYFSTNEAGETALQKVFVNRQKTHKRRSDHWKPVFARVIHLF